MQKQLKITIISLVLTPFFVFQSAVAHASNCDFKHLMETHEPSCVKAFLKKVPDPQDQSFARNYFKQKPDPKISFSLESGFLRVFRSGKQVIELAVLNLFQPTVIWWNGKIFLTHSTNPSVARRVDLLFKSPPSAAHNFALFPSAYAAPSTPALFMAHDVGNLMILSDEELPKQSWFSTLVYGPRQVQCSSQNLVEKSDFRYADGTEQGFRLSITPLDQDSFKVLGLKKNQTFLFKLASDHNSTKVSHCETDDCSVTGTESKLDDWNLVLKKTPEEEAKDAGSPRRLKTNTEIFKAESQKVAHQLTNHLLGLMVLSQCCESKDCQSSLLETYNIKVIPSPTDNSPAETID